MKTIIKMLFAVILLSGTAFATHAQSSAKHLSQKSGKYLVQTQLTEKKGSYEERKLYRKFLENYVKECPYVSHFNIREVKASSDNHEVVWSYEVNGWKDITLFYNWIKERVEASNDNGMKEAMTPYAPDYAIGGQIQMQKRTKADLAKE